MKAFTKLDDQPLETQIQDRPSINKKGLQPYDRHQYEYRAPKEKVPRGSTTKINIGQDARGGGALSYLCPP